jgi:hypothetical protein
MDYVRAQARNSGSTLFYPYKLYIGLTSVNSEFKTGA